LSPKLGSEASVVPGLSGYFLIVNASCGLSKETQRINVEVPDLLLVYPTKLSFPNKEELISTQDFPLMCTGLVAVTSTEELRDPGYSVRSQIREDTFSPEI